MLQRRVTSTDAPSAKRAVVDHPDANDVMAALRQLPQSAMDFTCHQLRLCLQAFGKSCLWKMKKKELEELLITTLSSDDEVVDTEKISKLREDIL